MHQRGNNNVYYQDNKLAWRHWPLPDEQKAFCDFVRTLLQIRRTQPVFQRRKFFLDRAIYMAKRSEDVRARLNVLSDLPEEWRACLTHWSRLNEQHRQHVDGGAVPDANEEYLLYQMLLGAWPLDPYTAAEYAEFVTRIQAYMLKALHEAKIHTSWVNPDPPYDEAVQHYVGQILDAQTNGAFLDDFRAFQRRVSHFGLLNSLAQTLLKIASPGVPDTYQGTEIWDFSLVDPDNRRPIDYPRRSRMLQQLQTSIVAAGEKRKELAGIGEVAWQDTSVLLEGIDPHQGWRHLFTGEPITFGVQEDGPSLAIAEVLTDFPVALLVAGDKRGDAA